MHDAASPGVLLPERGVQCAASHSARFDARAGSTTPQGRVSGSPGTGRAGRQGPIRGRRSPPTRPSELVASLQHHGVPSKATFVIHNGVAMIPRLAERTREVTAAQRARGLDTEGSLLRRGRGLMASTQAGLEFDRR